MMGGDKIVYPIYMEKGKQFSAAQVEILKTIPLRD